MKNRKDICLDWVFLEIKKICPAILLFFAISIPIFHISCSILNTSNLTARLISTFGSSGTGNGQFYGPEGIAVDASGNLYVTDNANNRVQKFNSAGTYLTQWGTTGSGNGQFIYPFAIAIDQVGNVYVVDGGNKRIQKFDSNGTYLTQWQPLGAEKSGNNAYFRIATDNTGHVYVAAGSTQIFNHGYIDTGSIQVFNSEGSLLTQWGSRGKGNGQFGGPTGIAIDAKGNVCVADVMDNRIQEFKPDGTYVTQWGNTSNGSNSPFVAPRNENGKFNGPGGIAADPTGKVFVVDSGNRRIQVFNSKGKYLTQWNPSEKDDNDFINHPGIAVDAFGYIYLTDTFHNCIQKFELVQNSDKNAFQANSSTTINPMPTPTVDMHEVQKFEDFAVSFDPNHSDAEDEKILSSVGIYQKSNNARGHYLVKFTNGMTPDEDIRKLENTPTVTDVSGIMFAEIGGYDGNVLIGFKPSVSEEEKRRVLTSIGLVGHSYPRSYLIYVTNGAPFLEELLNLRKDPAVLWTSQHRSPFGAEW
jgi:sugar lactone lactonase YvrE